MKDAESDGLYRVAGAHRDGEALGLVGVVGSLVMAQLVGAPEEDFLLRGVPLDAELLLVRPPPHQRKAGVPQIGAHQLSLRSSETSPSHVETLRSGVDSLNLASHQGAPPQPPTPAGRTQTLACTHARLPDMHTRTHTR